VATAAPARTRPERRSARSDSPEASGRAAIGLLAPFVILYVLFIIGPAVYGLILSFFDTSLVRSGLSGFAGLANYREALTNSDFWSSLWHTIWFTILTTPPLIVLGFVFALLADRVARGRWFFRLAFFAPFVMPSAVVALIWIWMYTPGLGLIEAGLKWIGVGAPNWLGDPTWAMPSLAITTIWWTLGFNFVLYLAGLQDIPRELYEAASVDGSTPWQQIRFITIPMLSRTTTLVILLQIIASLKIFDQVYLMTAGGPGTSTQVLLTLVANTAFTDYRVGAASAASVLLFIVILLVTVIRQFVQRAQERRAA
jgi:multiple sugar transport system permease protein